MLPGFFFVPMSYPTRKRQKQDFSDVKGTKIMPNYPCFIGGSFVQF